MRLKLLMSVMCRQDNKTSAIFPVWECFVDSVQKRFVVQDLIPKGRGLCDAVKHFFLNDFNSSFSTSFLLSRLESDETNILELESQSK